MQQSYLTVISRWNGYTAFSQAGRLCVCQRGTCVCKHMGGKNTRIKHLIQRQKLFALKPKWG